MLLPAVFVKYVGNRFLTGNARELTELQTLKPTEKNGVTL